jgi:hypothetical protein
LLAFRLRPTAFFATFAFIVVLACASAASAGATVTESQVTTPGSDPTYLPLYEAALSGPAAQTVSVSGTTDGNASDEVQLECFYVDSAGVQRSALLENLNGNPVLLKVHTDGSFTTADLSGKEAVSLADMAIEKPCVLRAVPPATGETSDVHLFRGPRLGDSEYSQNGASGAEYDDYLETTTLAGYWGWDSAGSCGPYGYLFDPATLRKQEPGYVADCEADLYETNEANTASSIVVDGHNAYDVESAHGIDPGAEGEPFLTSSHVELDPATGNLTQTVTENLVRCVESDGSAVDVVEPNSAECVKFVPSGVKLVRAVATGEGGLQATVTDQFESTDASSHQIDLSYGEEQNGSLSVHPTYEFPGDGALSQRAEGDSALTGTSAPETVFFQIRPEAASPENGLENPRGAITLSSVPSSVKFTDVNEFEVDYANRTVPASGALTLVHVLSQALTQAQITTLAQAAEDRLSGPSLSIASPANGATVSTPSVTVSGAASDNYGVASVTANGSAATLAANGAWSASVPLKVGPNTIVATASDHAGNTASSSLSVTYVPPPSPPPPPVVHASKVGTVSGAKGRVKLTLACKGQAGTSCLVQVTATTTERIRGGKLIGVAASNHKIHSKKVTVGTLKVRIAAGRSKTVIVTLNTVGRKLLSRYHKLPVQLTAVLIETGTKKSKVFAQNLTVKPPPKPKHRH